MANVIIKNNFKDGDKLFAQQLNNNFSTIMAALNAMNGVVWQGDNNRLMTIYRGTSEELEEREIIDGQILYDIDTGETYIDYNDERISTGSGNAIHVGSEAPTNPSTLLWIEPNDSLYPILTEVVDSLEGNQTDKAPSVHITKAALDAIYGIVESGTNANGSYIKFKNGTMMCWKTVASRAEINTAWGNLYEGHMSLGDSPQSFINDSYCILITPGDGSGVIIEQAGVDKTASNFGVTTVVRPTPAVVSLIIYVFAIGNWK